MKKQSIKFISGIVAAFVTAIPSVGWADVVPSALFTNHMVIQREAQAPVWGTADAGEKVTVTASWGKTANTTADASGKWMLKLKTPKAGGPYTLTIQGNNTIEIKDVLSGEVWFCSGQSNMEWEMSKLAKVSKKRTKPEHIPTANYVKKEMETASDELLRQFSVGKKKSPMKPLSTLKGSWLDSSPQNNPGFSATAYFFARELRKELKVPVGLILCAWGGTSIEPWMPAEAFQADKEMAAYYKTNPKRVSTLFNGMVNPVIPYAIRGTIWYQGEANRGFNTLRYERHFRAMINAWRGQWQQGDFPFYFAQLANCGGATVKPIEYDGWPSICDQQRRSLGLKNTGMAVLSDIGEAKDVHAHNKIDVGKRLALWALKHDYQKQVPVYSGPLYKSYKIDGKQVIIHFDHAGSGLMTGSKTGMEATQETKAPLKYFQICGADRQWKWAQAEITGKDTVTVSHPDVPNPTVVRYAWSTNAKSANLYNKEGLPASIFTTEAEIPAEVGAVAPVKAPPSRKKSLSGPPLKKNDRIIFLGDSITQLGVKEDGYVTLTAQVIAKACPDLGIEVIGAGRSGHKVPDCQKRLDRDVLQKKPSVVVIYIGINDVWHWSLRGRGGKPSKGTTPETFESGLKDMIGKINEVGARVILCTPTVIGEKPDGSNPQDKMLDEYAEISRKVARETKSQLLDLRAACIGYLKQHNPDNAERGILTGDRVHMNEAGNRFLSELMLDALNVLDKETMVSLAVAGPKQGDADYPPRNANPRHEKKVKGAVTFAASGKPFDITDLRCEYLRGPLGIDVENPRLSWVLESERRGERQTGYRVLVASTAELLAAEKGDMWDSGRVKSDRTINVVYAGKPLQERQQCFWKVRIWDKAGKPSAWSIQARWEMGLLKPQDWRAQWIRRLEPEPESEADHFSDRPVPLLRKEFAMEKPVARARAYISGLGYYELRLNGKRVGDHMLDPGWTTYSKRVLYSTYDVTEHLRNGRNAVGVILGNGWYNPLPLRQWGRLNLREHLTIGQPRVIMQLVIDYADGTSQTVITDGTWKTSQGPILRNNVYLGEVYDARREQPGWDKPDFKESKWQNAVAATESVGPLRAQNAPPIRVTKVLRPVKRTQTKPGTYVFDFGQNFAGWVRLHVKGPAGTTVQLRYGELLYPDGRLNAMTAVCGQIKKGRVQPSPGGPETAWQQDVYTLKGGAKETYTPRFTFHGFRYVEVTGYPGEPPLTALEGHRLNSAVNPSGNFACSNEQFNKIQQMIEWTFLSNLFSVQSDCPHREKWGYGGDIVCSSDTFLLNFDMATFYTKIVHDYADAVRPNGGMTETAPHVGVMDGGLGSGAGPIGWGTAFIQLQWQLHQYYGNRQLMEEYYPVTKQWVEFLRSCANDHIIKRGLSDHESLVRKPKALTGTAFYYDNVRTLSRIARVLGKTQDAEQYATLADDIKKAFNRQFLKPGTGAYDSATQASQSFALFYDLVPQEERQNALDVLVRNILEKRNGHLTTGIFGTRFMPLVLSDLGRTDLACTIVNQKEYPGWGYMLERGATTLWEHWKFSDNIFSHNHPMFGSVGEWFVKALAGIQPDPEMVGWDRLIIRPQPAPGLTWAKGEYQTIRGRVASQWRIEGGELSLHIVIPPNTTATVFVPTGDPDTVRESGKPAAQAQGVKFLRREQGAAVYQVGSGQYRFIAKELKTTTILPGVPLSELDLPETTADAATAPESERKSIIPKCKSLELQQGFYPLQQQMRISITGGTASEDQLKANAERFAVFLRKGAGLKVTVGGKGNAGESEIKLRVAPDMFEGKVAGAYRLSVDQKGIHIIGADAQGVFYGLQSLKQMLPAAIFHQDYAVHRNAFSDLRIDFVEIEDAPRFKWRGFMLDSCRHIQTIAKIKQYIDLMALYKMNVFHWHLTDDEAWRAEIKKYPKLTSIGGYPGDRSKDEELNGYYTQEQMREIVAYAHERYIKVVPEFDIPGHVNALLMAYPEYGCNDGAPLTMGEPGMRSFSSAAGRRAICAGKHETTIPFIMELFDELQTIFTDGLFHVGGDERPRGNWEKCPHCIALRNKLKLQDEHHLQNWFLNEVSERLRKRGIRSIGWAEHIQGGVPEGQIVQAWNKPSEALQGVRAGRDVINSYNRKIYLDYPANKADAEELNKHTRRYRGRLVPARSIYTFEPVPAGLTQEERNRIIGLEAPVWTEQILMDRLDRKVFPRLISVAEVGWTPAGMKSWESFQRRLEKHAQILEALNIAYDRSDTIIETGE